MSSPSPPPAPEPFDAAKATGEFYFGEDFSNFDGILDPRLQQKFIDAERTYGPEYAQLQLDNIRTMAQGADGEGGIFGILRDASRDAGALQREEVGLQRADDLTAVQTLAPQIVDAFRAADEESTAVAEAADARIGQGTGIGALGQSLIGSQLGKAGAEESALLQRGLSDIDSNVMGASEAEQQLQALGMSQSSLSPTQQEALISERGTEFIKSTGELTPLELRRATQSSRQASEARGRSLDQSAIYGEMANRFAQETNKRDRELALGSTLLGQEASMRQARLGQGAGMLTGSEALAAQRRAEQVQRQAMGASTLGASAGLSAQRRNELIRQQQLGAGLVGAEDSIQSGRLGQSFSMNRSLAGDLGSTILGRPSQSIPLGQSILGSATQGANNLGGQLFDQNAGINIGLQQRGQNLDYQSSIYEGQSGAFGGLMGGLGTLAGTALGGPLGGALGGKLFGGGSPTCWVAREVYGEDNPKWLLFRNWMLCDAPSWFRNIYIKYGERFAKFISNKPLLKNIIRSWMNTKIK